MQYEKNISIVGRELHVDGVLDIDIILRLVQLSMINYCIDETYYNLPLLAIINCLLHSMLFP